MSYSGGTIGAIAELFIATIPVLMAFRRAGMKEFARGKQNGKSRMKIIATSSLVVAVLPLFPSPAFAQLTHFTLDYYDRNAKIVGTSAKEVCETLSGKYGTYYILTGQSCWVIKVDWQGYKSQAGPWNIGMFNQRDVVSGSPEMCPADGHPIRPLIGFKHNDFDLNAAVAGRPLVLSYDSRRKSPSNDDNLKFSASVSPSFGFLWETDQHRRLVKQGENVVLASRGSSRWTTFTASNGSWATTEPTGDKLVKTSAGEWYYYDAVDQAVEVYLNDGTLKNIKYRDGREVRYTFVKAPVTDDKVLGVATDERGRAISFNYEQSSADVNSLRINSMNSSGAVTTFAYDGFGNLKNIHWPDETTTGFNYDDVRFPWALTGEVDENSSVFSSYGYDAQGRAVETQVSGGVDHYRVTWKTPPGWTIEEGVDWQTYTVWRTHRWVTPEETVVDMPNGQVSMLQATRLFGSPHLTERSQSAGAGCLASVKRQSFDSSGDIKFRDNFNQSRTCYAHDANHREVGRIEGLATDSVCEQVIGATVLPTNARKTTTDWHPLWRLATKVAEPRRITTSIYNGQPDPFNGGATSSCAPSNATLPDGSPIVVLCKQVEQATTDANGALGFSATVDTSVPTRTQQWTYNQYGQVLTAKDPLGNVTTNTYYADTTAAHTMGDLATVTNALNQAVNYTAYNPAGQWLTMVDVNGIATTRTFDLRQRLKTVTTAGLTTSYDYWPTGLLKTVTQPDASFLSYGYDGAHRLTSIADSLGNSITYTLDNSGNRTGENVTDPSGKLARTLTRVPDALNRIQEIIGRP